MADWELSICALIVDTCAEYVLLTLFFLQAGINSAQIKIGKIHIRFEDLGVSTNINPVAFGVTLHNLSASSAAIQENGLWETIKMGTCCS